MSSARSSPSFPPKVEYSISEEGRTLAPILLGLRDWGHGSLTRRNLVARDDHLSEKDTGVSSAA
ncbi:winged helix-turn-helix transcriptional regulator [Rhizobium sp. BK538]|uniref:winged helix-turn-helix transcriptional regulator n=1 Tax=Rhizobium sp. BK538 TaxID=2586984 RepID=UPI0017B2D5A0|nr:DNA-binding HxlR family transcriptional regulator [Rhizobium sp. BK538]